MVVGGHGFPHQAHALVPGPAQGVRGALLLADQLVEPNICQAAVLASGSQKNNRFLAGVKRVCPFAAMV